LLDLGAHLPALLRSPVYLSREKTPDILYAVRVCRHALVAFLQAVTLGAGQGTKDHDRWLLARRLLERKLAGEVRAEVGDGVRG